MPFAAPRNPVVAFFWAVVQVPRSFWWVIRFGELRALLVLPLVVSLVVGAGLLTVSFFAARPVLSLVLDHHSGVAWGVSLVLTHLVLAASAVVVTLQLQGGIASAYHERASLFVQRKLVGDAPPPSTGPLGVLVRAVKVLPGIRTIALWVLTFACSAALIFVPVAGPVLVVVSQIALAAGFLAHGSVIAARERLGLPRWLYLREPALLLGLTLGVVPFILFPPLALFGAIALSVCGTTVALGIQARRAAPPAIVPAHGDEAPGGGGAGAGDSRSGG
ncbi:MAG: hypothetical protein Q8L48_29695 [Archangium sp.]|nr:hypothetical protein [Archangium sp.]